LAAGLRFYSRLALSLHQVTFARQTAITFTVTLFDGRKLTLNDLRGKALRTGVSEIDLAVDTPLEQRQMFRPPNA
jgi:hypothetical protein